MSEAPEKHTGSGASPSAVAEAAGERAHGQVLMAKRGGGMVSWLRRWFTWR